MRMPRDISGAELARKLERFGYRVTRQTGSHIRLSVDYPSAHHVTVPNHHSLRVGALAAILADVAAHRRTDRETLPQELFSGK